MTPLRRHLRRARFALSALFAGVVIALALLVGVTQLVLPWLIRNPGRVEAWLSARLDRPVSIGHVSGGWVGGGPELTLDRVHIGSGPNGTAAVDLPRAELAVDLYAPFQKNRAWNEFRVVGLDLALVREADGTWQLHGFKSAPGSNEQPSMGALGALVLKDLKLTVSDPARGLTLLLGASELRVLNRGQFMRVLGKVRCLETDSPPFDVIADVDLADRSGDFYLGARDLDLAHLLAGHPVAGIELLAGRGDPQVWGRWRGGQFDDVRIKLDLRAAVLGAATPIAADPKTSVLARSALDRASLVARWQQQTGGWILDVADLVTTRRGETTPPARLTIARGGGDATTWRAGASALALEPLGSVAMLSDALPAGLRRWLYLADPAGTLDHATLAWNSRDDFDVDATLDGAGFRSVDLAPGFDHANVALHGDAEALVLTVPEQPLRVDYPHVFRRPLVFSRFGGDIAAFRTDAAWRVATDRVVFEGEGYGGELRGGVEIHDDRAAPLLDLSAVITHADVAAAKQFWPVNIMPPSAVEWLDNALVGGRISAARAVIRGEAANWPFRDASGRFEADAEVEDASLRYAPDWPVAEHIQARADFLDTGLTVSASAAEVKGNPIASAEVSIADLGDVVLDLALKGSGTGKSLLDFLRATPVGAHYQEYLKDLAVGGKGALAFTLNLPVGKPEQMKLDGTVDLTGSDLDDSAWNLHFTQAKGRIRFGQGGFVADSLAVLLDKQPVTLSMAVGGFAKDSRHALEARLRGRLPVATVFAGIPALAPTLVHFPGKSDWTIDLAVDQAQGTEVGRKRLTLASDLVGIASDLPAPLAKPVGAVLPFTLALDLPWAGQPFDAKLGDIGTVHGRLPGPGVAFAARAEFGAQSNAELPAHGVIVGGHPATADADGWISLFGGFGGGSGGLLSGIDVTVGNLLIAGRGFADTQLVLTPGTDGTEIKLDGASIAGELHVPGSELMQRGLTVRLQRLHWPEAPPGSENQPSALADLAPATLPPLHAWVGDFRLGEANFGEARFESVPRPDGMHIDQMQSNSPNVEMHARGDWTGSAQDNHSHLVIDMTARNLGHMLDALGFAGVIDGGRTLAHIDAEWPGPPSSFALANLSSGTLDVKVDKGRILEAHPGAGRIFGLLSLSEIPRRLSLDFSDLFRSGLSFNSIVGQFTLKDGNAYTRDLEIDSPAADIRISGRTGLRAKDYDQEMTVIPHAGVTLPVVGALAGGPVGAAAGLVVQGLLNKQINQAASSRYHVGGTWEKPQITLLAKQGGKAKTGAAAARSGSDPGSR